MKEIPKNIAKLKFPAPPKVRMETVGSRKGDTQEKLQGEKGKSFCSNLPLMEPVATDNPGHLRQSIAEEERDEILPERPVISKGLPSSSGNRHIPEQLGMKTW